MTLRSLVAVGCSCLLATAAVQAADKQTFVERGRYLAAAAGCISCHTDKDNDGKPFAGGYEIETPLGVFIAPNITPDPETGIGGWTDDEFVKALRDGISPNGELYYPAFPYASYAGMASDDALAIKAWLDTLEPVRQTNAENNLEWFVPGRWSMRVWQTLFAPWQYAPPGTTAELRRGAYLVRHVGHCGECHTPRNALGALDLTMELAGSPKGALGGGAPAIDSSKNGIRDWATSDIELFLEIGMMPDGDFAGGGMSAVIDGTAQLTADDRRSIVRYLQSINPE